AHAVVHLEALAEPSQDRDRVLDRRSIDEHGLEAALERGVLLEVLAVLIERRRADAVELAASEHRLEQVAGVHRSFGASGADDRVELVDEEDDPSVALLDLLEDRLETLLELAAVLRAGDERAHVELEDRPVLEPFGHVAAQDALREPFDDGRLADARLADEDRVVLRLPRQDANDAADLLIAPDHGIELSFAREIDEIAAVLLERLVRGLGVRRRDALLAAHVLERLANSRRVDSRGFEDAPSLRGRISVEDREQDVLHAHVLVTEFLRLLLGRDQDLLERRAQRHLS